MQEWCSQACSPDRARETYTMLSRFSAFLRAEDPRHAAPPIGAFGARRRPRPASHLQEHEQITAILSAALTLPNRTITRYSSHFLLGLLAVSGIRVSKVIHLQKTGRAHV